MFNFVKIDLIQYNWWNAVLSKEEKRREMEIIKTWPHIYHYCVFNRKKNPYLWCEFRNYFQLCRFLAIQQVHLTFNIQNYVLWVYIKEVKLPVFSLTLRFHFKPFFHCFHPHVSSTNVHVKSPRTVSIDKLINILCTE